MLLRGEAQCLPKVFSLEVVEGIGELRKIWPKVRKLGNLSVK